MPDAAPHPFADVLARAARGVPPVPDGAVEVLPPDGRTVAVCEFTAHSFLLADVGAHEVAARRLSAYGDCLHPDTLRWLAGEGYEIGSVDVVLVAHGRGAGGAPGGPPAEAAGHPRVARAHRFRTDVRVHGDDAGVAVLGRGLVGRWELAVELFDHTPHGRGHGRRLAALGLDAAPAGSPVWAQVAPGNAASLRAFLAAGFHPVGSEALLTPR